MEYRRKLTDQEKELYKTNPLALGILVNREIFEHVAKNLGHSLEKGTGHGKHVYFSNVEITSEEVSVKIQNPMYQQLRKNEIEALGFDKKTSQYKLLLHLPGKTRSDVRLEMDGSYLRVYTDDYKESVKVGRGFFDVRKRDAGDGLVEVILS